MNKQTDFNVGDRVYWESQSQGCWVTKHGTVYEVVSAEVRPSHRDGHTCLWDAVGGARLKVSYLVLVKTPFYSKAMPRLYWPVTSKLRRGTDDA